MSSLRTLGSRSLLALLGAGIGCAMVVAMLNIGRNATADAIAVFKGMGVETLTIGVSQDNESSPPLRGLDTSRVLRAVPGLSGIAPLAKGHSTLVFQGRSVSAAWVASTPGLAWITRQQVREGRALSALDARQAFAVVGVDLAHALGTPRRPLRVGDRMVLDGYLFTVIGLLERQPDSPLLPFYANETLFLPLQGLPRLGGPAQISDIIARGASGVALDGLADTLHEALVPLLPGRTLDIRRPQEMIDGMNNQMRTFTYLLSALATVSSIGAGVGLMNIMLANVTQRRREIGVRLALGARPADIRDLFLLEALGLSAVGALAGAAVGVAGAFLYSQWADWAFALAPSSLFLGVGSTVLVGLTFGLYPALCAARMQPVVALRDD